MLVGADGMHSSVRALPHPGALAGAIDDVIPAAELEQIAARHKRVGGLRPAAAQVIVGPQARSGSRTSWRRHAGHLVDPPRHHLLADDGVGGVLLDAREPVIVRRSS